METLLISFSGKYFLLFKINKIKIMISWETFFGGGKWNKIWSFSIFLWWMKLILQMYGHSWRSLEDLWFWVFYWSFFNLNYNERTMKKLQKFKVDSVFPLLNRIVMSLILKFFSFVGVWYWLVTEPWLIFFMRLIFASSMKWSSSSFTSLFFWLTSIMPSILSCVRNSSNSFFLKTNKKFHHFRRKI